MRICDYGCGNKAIHQFKSGKWCCSKSYNSCPTAKNNFSKAKKGKKLTTEHKSNISKAVKGTKHSIESKEKRSVMMSGDNNNMFGKQHSKQTKLKMSKSQTGKHNKPMLQKTKQKLSKTLKGKNKITIEQIKNRYPIFFIEEPIRYNPNNFNEIQVHCKNHLCPNSKEQGGWFIPTRNQMDSRIGSLDRYGEGNGYMYCSDKCKQSCDLYGKRVSQFIKTDQINAGHIKEELYTSEEYQTFRQQVLNREDYLCEYCEKKANHVHHSRPQKLEPGFVLDPDFGVACCEKCHYKYGHKDECSTGQLANKICV